MPEKSIMEANSSSSVIEELSDPNISEATSYEGHTLAR